MYKVINMPYVKDLVEQHETMKVDLAKIQNLISYLDEWIAITNQTVPEGGDARDVLINALEQAKMDINALMTTKAQEMVEIDETDLDNAGSIQIVKRLDTKVVEDVKL